MELSRLISLQPGNFRVNFLRLMCLWLCFAGLSLQASAEQLPVAEELVVAVPEKFPPYYQTNPKGETEGFAIDMFNAVAERAGLRFRYQVYLNWMDVISAIKTGEADIIPIFGISQQRREFLDFTSSVMTFPISIFVRSSFQEIESTKDLTNRKVAVIKSNVAVPVLKNLKDVELVIFSDLDIAFHALIRGEVDAFAHPEPVTWNMAQSIDLDDKIKAIEPPLMEVKHAIAIGKKREQLMQQLDTGLRAFLNSPDYEKIYQQWFVLPEKSFWDAKTVFWTMTILMVILTMLFLILRHRELIALNASLQQQIDDATSQLSQSNEFLKDLTVTDALTGINNRRAFEHSLNELMTRAHRYQQSFSMLIFDIDDFKKLNDTYGHDMGDRVLQEIVDRIKNTVRDVDILCRWGGEEFTILMPETQKDGALKMAERCRRAIAEELFDEVGVLSISLGGTCYQPDDNERKLFKRADDALYQAKAEGKNRVVWK
ncbi:MAG: diguanylate cyclase [Gammaproteobacteria bacterium]|nr:diguanylate cyclase [Gammaproteobacteria bacterium]